jgi:hypothetical protein
MIAIDQVGELTSEHRLLLPLEQFAEHRVDVIGTADLFHREVRVRRLDVLIGKPEALVLRGVIST